MFTDCCIDDDRFYDRNEFFVENVFINIIWPNCKIKKINKTLLVLYGLFVFV